VEDRSGSANGTNEDTASLYEELTEKMKQAVRVAPGLSDDARRELESGLSDPTGSPDALLRALSHQARAAYKSRRSELRRKLDRLEPELKELEERAWRHRENPLHGGRGAGTLSLLFLLISFGVAMTLRTLSAVIFITTLFVLCVVTWCVYNPIIGRQLERPYLKVLAETKALWRAERSLEEEYKTYLRRESEVEDLLRARRHGAPEG